MKPFTLGRRKSHSKSIQNHQKINQNWWKKHPKWGLGAIWSRSGSRFNFESMKWPLRHPRVSDLDSIFEVKIQQKSIKISIKFYIKFWKWFFIDFEWILTYFSIFFSSKWLSKSKKAILWKWASRLHETLIFIISEHVFATEKP